VRRILQVAGVLLILVGVRGLLASDWLVFAMNTSLGVSLLIDPRRSKTARRLRESLILMTVVLAAIRLATILIG
jgi:hypothetical protein